jgi:hypothetical protein
VCYKEKEKKKKSNSIRDLKKERKIGKKKHLPKKTQSLSFYNFKVGGGIKVAAEGAFPSLFLLQLAQKKRTNIKSES